MERVLFLFLFVALLSACGGGENNSNDPPPAPKTKASEFYPLSIGNKWQYQLHSTKTDEKFSFEMSHSLIESLDVLNGENVHKIKRYAVNPDEHGAHDYMASNSDGIFLSGMAYDYDPTTGNYTTLEADPFIKYLNSSFDIGDSWETITTVTISEPGGQIQGQIKRVVQVLQADAHVTSCQAQFSECYKIHIETQDLAIPPRVIDTADVWLAKNIGIYRMENQYDDGWSGVQVLQYASIDGTETGQLVPVLMQSIFDDFNDNELSLSWRYDLEEASSWNYVENDSSLTVSGITPTPAANFPNVSMQQILETTSEFDLQFDFSWNDPTINGSAVQSITMLLLDQVGETILWTGYMDRWNNGSGSRMASSSGSVFEPGVGDLPMSGSATITISRVGSAIDMKWDGATIMSATDSREVKALEISFSHDSVDGSVSTDLIRFDPR